VIAAVLMEVVWVFTMSGPVVMTWPPRYMLVVGSGLVSFVRNDVAKPSNAPSVDVSHDIEWGMQMWFGYDRHDGIYGRPARSVWHAPLWPFILLTGVPGVWMLVKTRQRTNPHACPACGYDRTGLPQSSTGPAPCPECGRGRTMMQ